MNKTALLSIFLLASTVHAGTVLDFKGGSFPIKKKTGEFIEVVRAEFEQSNKMENMLVFTKKDGTEGFILTDNIELNCMKEIIRIAEGESVQNIEIPRTTKKTEKDKSKSIPSFDEYYFDSRKYCKEVSNVIGGSYQIEDGCMQNERTSEKNLKRTSVPSEIIKYCKEVSNVVGGSYQIMDGCVTNELNAKRSLGR
jgi:hypothetical protein